MGIPETKHAQYTVSRQVYDDKQAADAAAVEIEAEGNNPAYVAMGKYRANNNRLLRRPEVEARTGLSRSTIYDWMKRGDFPQPVKLGARLVAWRESDVTEWLESRETRAA